MLKLNKYKLNLCSIEKKAYYSKPIVITLPLFVKSIVALPKRNDRFGEATEHPSGLSGWVTHRPMARISSTVSAVPYHCYP